MSPGQKTNEVAPMCLMAPRFTFTSVAMESDVRNQRMVFGWALPASLVVHLLIAAILIFGLPTSLLSPDKEQAVAVELVPPPNPAEKTAAEPPPPPPEKPKAEKSPEPHVEGPSAAKNDPAQQAPVPTIRPVVEFGEKDEGPRQSIDGDSTEDEAPAPVQEADKQDLEALLAAAEAEQSNPAAQPTMPQSQQPEPAAPEPPAAKPEAPAKARKPATLEKAKKLFSRAAAGNARATTAMGNIPRPVRAGQLCLTELRAQLMNGSPPYFPDLLPSEFRNDGKTVDIPKTAFRASGQWYDLGYRCEVDTDALRVVSFAFRVGKAIPSSEWKRRGLPAQ